MFVSSSKYNFVPPLIEDLEQSFNAHFPVDSCKLKMSITFLCIISITRNRISIELNDDSVCALRFKVLIFKIAIDGIRWKS